MTNPVANEISPSVNFLVDPSDFTMSFYLASTAPEVLPKPLNQEVYLEEWPAMQVGVTNNGSTKTFGSKMKLLWSKA